MRIIFGKSSGKANNGNNTTDFGGPGDNDAAQLVPTGMNRVHLNRSSPPNLNTSNYLTPNSPDLTPSRLSKTCYPKNTYRKRKTNISPERLFDPFDLDVFLHQNKQSKLSSDSDMVSSNTKPKPTTNCFDPLVEAVADSLAAPGATTGRTGSAVIGTTKISQGSYRTNPRAEETSQQLQISHSSLSVSDENESPTEYDPNNPAVDEYYDGEDELARDETPYTQTHMLNHTKSKTVLSPSPQCKRVNPQCSPISSVSGCRNSSTESSSMVGKSRENDFISLMKKQLKFDIVEMDGDGNCLFRAVALQVYGDASMHSEVRRRCLEFMGKNEEHYSQFLTDEEPFHEYMRRKRLDGVHGNHVEIQAISELYNRPVEVYTPENGVKPINIFHTEYKTSDHPIRLSYHDGNHYNAVIDPYCPTAGLGLGLPGLKPGLADEMQLKEALIDSDRLDLDRLYVEKAIRESEQLDLDRIYVEKALRESENQFYKEKALELSDLEQTDFELEQAIIQSSLESSYNIKQPRRTRETPTNNRSGAVRNRISPHAEGFSSENAALSGGNINCSIAAAASSNRSSSYLDETLDNPAAHDDFTGAFNAGALTASEYPDSVTELVMNGFELSHVLRAYELVGDNFDDLLAFLINSC